MEFTLQELQAALPAAKLTGDAGVNTRITGLTTDSRKVGAGDLFVALRGENFDAHDFLPQVAAAGAAAVIAEHLPADFNLPALQVADSKLALVKVGAFLASKI